jgi:hypothetical protein
MNEVALYSLGEALPVCAVCNKPVDKVESMYHPNYMGKFFRVYCHGKIEEQMLSDYDFYSSLQITFDLAFQRPLGVTHEHQRH